MLPKGPSRTKNSTQKYASDPRPPHTRQKYEQTSEQNMTRNALKQGKFGSLGGTFLFIFLPCMWGLGLQKESPSTESKFSTGSEFATAGAERYGECSEKLVFPGKKRQENGTESKKLWR